jgi:hypothetical protein
MDALRLGCTHALDTGIRLAAAAAAAVADDLSTRQKHAELSTCSEPSHHKKQKLLGSSTN